MPRIPEITQRDQLPESQRHHFDSIVASRGFITAPYRYLLHVPEFAARMAHLTAYSRFEKREESLPEHIKELTILVVAREFDCVYEWGDHEQRALDAGVSRASVEAIKSRRAPEGLAPEEAITTTYLQQLLRPPHRVADDVFEAMKQRLGVALLVELTGIVGAYSALACTFNAFNVPPGEGLPVMPT